MLEQLIAPALKGALDCTVGQAGGADSHLTIRHSTFHRGTACHTPALARAIASAGTTSKSPRTADAWRFSQNGEPRCRVRTALRLPYEPGSLNAKQWLRSLENRECLLLFERGVTMLNVEGGGQEQHLWN